MCFQKFKTYFHDDESEQEHLDLFRWSSGYRGNRCLVQWINKKLQQFSDKDWNYSRIRLLAAEVSAVECPYLLGAR